MIISESNDEGCVPWILNASALLSFVVNEMDFGCMNFVAPIIGIEKAMTDDIAGSPRRDQTDSLHLHNPI